MNVGVSKTVDDIDQKALSSQLAVLRKCINTLVLTIGFAFFSWISSGFAQGTPPIDFPILQNTGDKQADNKAYDEAKKAWVEANPEAYIEMGGQIQTTRDVNNNDPEEVVSENCITENNDIPEIPDNSAEWQLSDATIIDDNNQLTQSELQEQRSDFQNEMLSNTIVWSISPDDMLYILSNEQYTNHFRLERTDSELQLFPHDDSACNNQVKNYHIEEWTDSQISINIPDEDEGSTLIYQIRFTPKF